MKKVILLLTCLCLIFSAAFAEEGLVLDWADVGTEEVAALGEFQQIELPDMPTIVYWIPSGMVAVDVGGMEGPFTPSALYVTEDQAYSVTLFAFEISSLEEYAVILESEGGASNFSNVTVNGVDCIRYEVASENMECLIYPLTEQMILSFSFVPMDGDEEWDATKGVIVSSIQLVV